MALRAASPFGKGGLRGIFLLFKSPLPPFAKGGACHLYYAPRGIFPSLIKRGEGRFYNPCQFYYENLNNDELVKSPKTPSPLSEIPMVLRGWERVGVRVRNTANSACYNPLPFIPSHQGKGNMTFHKPINNDADEES